MHYLSALAAPIFLVSHTQRPFIPPSAKLEQNRYCRLISAGLLLFLFLLTPGAVTAQEDGPYVPVPPMIDTPVEYDSTDVGTTDLPTATTNVVGSVTGARLSVDVLSLDEGDGSTALTVTATLRHAATSDTTITLDLPTTRPTSPALLPNLTVATWTDSVDPDDSGGESVDPDDYTTTFDATTHTITIAQGGTSGTTTFNIDPRPDTTTEGTETIIITGTATFNNNDPRPGTTDTGTNPSITPTEVYLEDGPYVAFSSMIDTRVEYYSTDVGTITLPTATNNVVGSVTYAVTSDPATPTNGLTHTQADTTTPGTLTGTTAGSASTTRYTITATDNMNTTSDTTDDKTATTIVSVNVIQDQCTAPTGWYPAGVTTPSAALIKDCNILLAAKASFVANSSPSTYTPNWATDTPMFSPTSSWEKVTLLNGTERVIRLEIKPESSHPLLPSTPVNLKGPIPPVLGGLTSLQKLQFFRTRWLSEKIPPELGSLSSLAELDLGENQLSGAIPTELGGLASLEKLLLNYNQLSGAIPRELGKLANLMHLKLSGNTLSGSIPWELGKLSLLRDLNLGENQLSGAIPPRWDRMPNLRLFGLGRLNVDKSKSPPTPKPVTAGPVPYLNSTALQYLYLNYTNRTGSLPWELKALTALQRLELSDNQLSGPIPPELENLTTLQNIFLENNQLSGSIPTELGNLTNLSLLYLHNNQLSGSIPTELGSLTALTQLNLSNNQLSGSIPTELGDLSSLWYLHLNNNQLSGSIPSKVGTLTNLQGLYLNNNQLSGSIPSELGNLSGLRYLHLNNNQLSGSIPTELGNLSSLLDFYLNNNQLSGSIPTELGNLSSLWYLYLHNNQLSGSIPTELGNLSSLYFLQLNDNQLSGSIPTELGNLTNLWVFYLQSNQLSGSIPKELGNLSNLLYLQLGNNQLSGPIPPELGNLSSLSWLLLAGNALSGPIPSELGNLANLRYLYLYGNQLEDPLPATFAKLTNLPGFLFDYNESSCLPTGLDDEWYDKRSFSQQDAVEVHCAYSRPQAPTLTAGETSLTLTWEAYTSTHTDDATDPSPSFAVSDYEVQYRAGTTGRWYTVEHVAGTHPTTGTSYQITGLTSGTSYYVRYRARTPHATEANRFYGTRWSAAPTLIPGVSLTADNITTTSANLNIHDWTDAWRHKSEQHTVHRCNGGPSVPHGTATDALTGLTPSTTYTYTAYRAEDGASTTNGGATPESSHCTDDQTLATVTFTTKAPTRVGPGPVLPPDDDDPTNTPPTSSFENPKDGSTVSGVDIIRGWSFAEEDGVGIASVELFIDRQRVAFIPCCSARPDVAEAYPRFPEASHSGWGITWNWGNLTAGEHTVRVVATSTTGGSWESERSTVTVVKPGGSTYADRFSLAEAEAGLDKEHVVLTGVVLRDKETQEEHEVVARYAWQEGAQGVRLVASRTLETARVQPVGLERLLAGALRWGWGLLSPGSVTATEGITVVYEAPKDREPVAGIGLIRGWAFPDDVTDAIATVTVQIDDTLRESMPCCSTRRDVADFYPEQANAEQSGWGSVFNYGRLPEGPHPVTVTLTTAAGLTHTETHTVVVAQLGGYAFIDRFDLSEATAEIVGEEIILSGVAVRDKASQAWQTIDVHLQWSLASQGLVIVDTETLP